MKGASASSRDAGSATSTRSWWALVPVVLLLAMLGGLGTMAAIAVDDPSFAIEKDYYKKAVAWDDELAQQAENRRLAWKLEVETRPGSAGRAAILVRVVDSSGSPVGKAEVGAEAFHNARSGERFEVALKEREDGKYTGDFPLTRPGLWELRLVVKREHERFTEIVRSEIRGVGGGS